MAARNNSRYTHNGRTTLSFNMHDYPQTAGYSASTIAAAPCLVRRTASQVWCDATKYHPPHEPIRTASDTALHTHTSQVPIAHPDLPGAGSRSIVDASSFRNVGPIAAI